jgi:hypothetical protein
LPLVAGEQQTGGRVLDSDGRLIVVGPGGVAIGGGGGGSGADPLSDGTPGGALPTKTLWVAGADGAVLRGIAVNASGHVLTAVQNFPATQAVSDGGGSLTVDGTVTANAGTGPWPVTDNGGTLSVDDAGGKSDGRRVRVRLELPGDPGGHRDVLPGDAARQRHRHDERVPRRHRDRDVGRFDGHDEHDDPRRERRPVRRIDLQREHRRPVPLLGAGTESATVYTLQMAAGSYYETPFGFTGIIKGHWASANGSARIVEYT